MAKKIHIKYIPDAELVWHIRYGNQRLMANHLLIFIQLVANENGDLEGIGEVEDYGHDTLILKNPKME